MLCSTLVLALFSASLTAAVPSTHDHVHPTRAHATKRGTKHALMLQVKAQDNMSNPDELTVAATICNTGSKAVKILNDPNSALSTWKTHTFNFVSASSTGSDGLRAKSSNVQADVNAIRIKYNPLTAAALDDDSAYTILQPGENKTVVHDLSGMYNFHSPGAYTVKLAAPAEYFSVVEDDGSISSVPAVLYTGSEADKWSALNVLVNANLKSAKGLVSTGIATMDLAASAFGLNRRMIRRTSDPKFTNCSAEQQANITAALPFVNQYIANANQYLNGTIGDRYISWFGAKMDNRTEIIKGHFANLTGKPEKFQFDCSCDQADTYAFVYPNKFPMIHLCGAFWRAPANGTDSKAGTIVHEGTHFTNIGSTDDYAYGQSGAQSLAKSDPDHGIMNADSHEYFVENNPHQD